MHDNFIFVDAIQSARSMNAIKYYEQALPKHRLLDNSQIDYQ